jgi:aminomethyltransferase
VTELRRTPLADAHRRLGARMVPFAGFEMPVQYTSILEEHRAVRERAGLFDVSHMGQIHVAGPGALATTERLVTCPVATLKLGQVRYGLLCNERGGVVDDVTVYRLADDAFFLCVNASNVEKDFAWMREHAGPGARVEDRSARFGLLALQGPRSADVLRAVSSLPPPGLPRFRFVEGEVAGVHVLASRTGYTGSDGFELYVEAARTETLWSALLEAGRPLGLLPAGLGARDTLRLEAALPLYGHELDDDTSPLEAGLDRFVKLAAGGFVGAEALAALATRGIARRLAGFVVEDRSIARAGHTLLHDGVDVGRVTSGAPSPSLGKPIGLGYVPPRLAQPGTALAVAIRDRAVPAVVVETPFVK